MIAEKSYEKIIEWLQGGYNAVSSAIPVSIRRLERLAHGAPQLFDLENFQCRQFMRATFVTELDNQTGPVLDALVLAADEPVFAKLLLLQRGLLV